MEGFAQVSLDKHICKAHTPSYDAEQKHQAMTLSKIASARQEAGMTQAQLAAAINVSVDTIRRAEQNKHQTRILTLIRMSHAMGVPLESLVPDEPART